MAPVGCRTARGAGGVLARGGVAGGLEGLGEGELLGLPLQEDLFQAGENAGQAGDDEGVDGVGDPGALLLCQKRALKAGDLSAEGGSLVFHVADTN